ncbi:Aste57867_21670 [Aphanomyces stellatus]|uniref:Aste57867_21670 protein n=1 Tax=Aphanomyces stellatus TaxID=120398 RepID=A0A485LJD0_9STRA|nr:hypothetical protein As57867_021601 [Aphanomyces stellatus]VFT98339.1 Aste57867_21670 [Aphanomyces stellatus]
MAPRGPSVAQDVAGIGISLAIVFAIAIPHNLTLYAAVAFGVNWLSALLYAIPRQSETFYDLTGAATFVTLSLLVTAVHAATSTWRSLVASALVLVWSIRLGSFLFERIHATGVDKRFTHIRTSPTTFFMAWTMQGLWNFCTILPVLLLHTASSTTRSSAVVATDVLGLTLWAVGFAVEVTADLQKKAFRANRTFITTGLWRFSRHPNYFGEILLWVGVVVLCAPQYATWSERAVSCASPLLVATLLLFVSGIPMLERLADKKWGAEAAYQAYKRRTSILVPWFPTTSS